MSHLTQQRSNKADTLGFAESNRMDSIKYDLNKSAHQEALAAAQEAHQSRQAVRNERDLEQHLPAPQDPAPDALQSLLNQRQQRLEKLVDMESLVQQARNNVMSAARNEFAALMQQLNAPRRTSLAPEQAEQAARQDQPEICADCLAETYQSVLCEIEQEAAPEACPYAAEAR